MTILPIKRDSHFGRVAWLPLTFIIEPISATLAVALYGANPFLARTHVET